MRIAVISDIHGNRVALDAVLADLELNPAEFIVCLGDAIQGGPQPAQVVSRLRELACPVVMGNADAYLLSGAETGNEQISPQRLKDLTAVRQWSFAQLSADDKAFIASFAPTVEIPLNESRKLICFHGSPASFDDVILPQTPDADVRGYLGAYLPNILTGGHTHLQQIRRLDDSFFFNPGSVGYGYRHNQPEDTFRADPWAEYAVLTVEDGRTSLEFRKVPFDLAELIAAYRASGRPYVEKAIGNYEL